jgi:glycosyltransferase involved in cell wall biosynthesis
MILERLFGRLSAQSDNCVEETPLRVAIVSFDEPAVPCARLRLLDPLAKCGERVEARRALKRAVAGWTFEEETLDWAQLIVVQRGVPRGDTVALCDRVLASARPVVYEIDDCLPEVPDYLGKDAYRLNRGFILDFARRASMVTVSTEALRQYFAAHNTNTVVLPNYLNDELWTDDLVAPPASSGASVTLGYCGNPGHQGDLRIAAPVLHRLLEDFEPVRLAFLGCAPEGFEAGPRCTIVPPDWNYAAFPRKLAAMKLDIAIAPLLDNAFNRCVSHLKFLEYGFLGIPAVYSDMPAYRSVGDGGLLCGPSESAWYTALTRLVRDPAMRASTGQSARHAVRSRWMLSPHAHRWVETYSTLAPAPGAPHRLPAQT